MKLNISGLHFECRTGTSDSKAVVEVVEKDSYQKRGLKIEAGEHWLDLGSNIGAFMVLALSKGAEVTAFEPDPVSCGCIKDNLVLNNLQGELIQAGADLKDGKAYLNISKTNQFWRNSMVKYWGGPAIPIKTVDIRKYIKPGVCIKMDIEGMEMPLLEKCDFTGVKKLVFEWSFDVDDDIDRYRAVVERMSTFFKIVKADKIKPEHKVWQKSWFPPAKMVHCYNENS